MVTPSTLHTPYRPALLNIINGGGYLLKMLFGWQLDLSEETLIRKARDMAGCEDFGDESFRVPMRQLLHSLETEANLSTMGRIMQRSRLVRSAVLCCVVVLSVYLSPSLLLSDAPTAAFARD